MGLHMDDIHTPTVPSGPTTGQRVANGGSNEKRSLMELIDEKTGVEEELSALGSVLDSVCFILRTLRLESKVASNMFWSVARGQHEYKPHNLRWLPKR